MLEEIDYDQRQYAVYAQGRALSAPVLAMWMREFSRYADQRRPLTVLDLGSGIGRFTPALAEEFGGPVYGVEPSVRMRTAAIESASHPNVTYLAGSAERIPLPDESCDVILMYLVLHHVRDKPAAAAEIARALRPGGRLLIRSAFADRMHQMLWHRYFPRARVIEQELFPAAGEVIETFDAVGLRYVALEPIRHRFAESLGEYASRLRLRAISVFEYLTDEETERGFVALDADVAAETVPQPVEEDCDLLVLSRQPPVGS